MKAITVLKGIACLFALNACSPNQTEQTSDLTGEVSPDIGAGLMNMGYDSHSESLKGSCVENSEPQIYYGGAQRSEIRFDRRMTAEELATALDVQVSGKLNLSTFNVSGAAHFVTEAASSELSDSVIFSYQVRGKNALVRHTRLTQQTRDQIVGRGTAEIRKSCGDSFISEVELGAQLFLAARFDYANAEAKSKFEAQIDFSYMNLFEVSGAASTALDQLKSNVSVTFSALQIGGNVEQLSSVLGSSGGEDGIPILRCALDNRQACLETFEKMIRYASSEGEGGFIDQVRNLSYEPGSSGGAAFLGYKTKTYYEAGHYDLYPAEGPLLDQAIADIREGLVWDYGVQSRYYKRAQVLSAMRLKEAEREKIANTKAILKRNISEILRVATICYNRPGLCIETNRGINLSDYDPATLSKIFTFYDYCDLPGQSPTIVNTVTAIRKSFHAQEAECDQLENDLLHSDELDLSQSNPPISDLRPLRGLEHLLVLDISKNQVRNLSVLGPFKELRHLKARENLIGNIHPVAQLPKLTWLDLAYNRIVDAEPLRNNRALKTLLIHENRIIEYDPLLTLPAQTLIYSKEKLCQQERDFAYQKGWVDERSYQLFSFSNFAPKYQTPGDRFSGINGWFLCDLVFNEFDPGFAR